MTFNEKLKQALAENHDERMNRLAPTDKKHRFSLAYRIWERRMLKNLRNDRPAPVWSLRKVRRIVTVSVFAAAVTFVLTAGAIVGITTGRFSFNDKREYSELFMSNLSSDKTRFEEYYGLPEEDGWEITDFGELTNHVLISYKRGEEIVSFEQALIHENMGIVDTENAIIEPMSMYSENDGFFIEFQSGSCGLWWIYDGYLLSAIGNLNKEELLNLAYSTKIIKFKKNSKYLL